MPRVVVGMSAGWGASQARANQHVALSPKARPVDCAAREGWRVPVLLPGTRRATWSPSLARNGQREAAWGVGAPRESSRAGIWGMSLEVQRGTRGIWATGRGCDARAGTAWARRLSADAVAQNAWGGGSVLRSEHHNGWGASRGVGQHVLIRWARGVQGTQDFRVVVPAPEPLPPEKSLGIQRVYVVINEVTLQRESNGVMLPVLGMTVSGSYAAAHWSWNATLPAAAYDDLEPDQAGVPVVVRATVNGTVFRLVVEGRSVTERWGQQSLTVRGRGIACVLSAPGAPSVQRSNANVALASQLASQALEVNGTATDWTLDWRSVDWLVPAGVWAHTGTPIEALVRLAEAAGAYVASSRESTTVSVRPTYPVAPWAWGMVAADVELPAAATFEISSDDVAGVNPNVTFIQGAGLLARVRIQGTAGDVPQRTIVDSLTCTSAVARERGISELAAGRQRKDVKLETGVVPEIGVVEIGSILDWVRGANITRGIVRNVEVNARMSGERSMSVRQVLGVEVHG